MNYKKNSMSADLPISLRLETILDRAVQGIPLPNGEMVFILSLRQPDHVEAVFEAARIVRAQHFGDEILLYGFLYVSTYCRNHCHFCLYRSSHKSLARYRKEEGEILKAAVGLAESGVHLIDLTMGEDPWLFDESGKGFDELVHLVERVKQTTGLPIMVSPGVVPGDVLKALAEAGADWFACYQETHNRVRFEYLRPGQDYDARMNAKIQASQYGLAVEEGILTGLGESPTDITHSLTEMRLLDAGQVRVMNFVPQPGTPLANYFSPDPMRELLTIALMRLVFPAKHIPATLDIEGLAGLNHRLRAGANVVTSLVPPGLGLAGVAQAGLDIDQSRRTSASVAPILKSQNLRIAAPIKNFCRGPGGNKKKEVLRCE